MIIAPTSLSALCYSTFDIWVRDSFMLCKYWYPGGSSSDEEQVSALQLTVSEGWISLHNNNKRTPAHKGQLTCCSPYRSSFSSCHTELRPPPPAADRGRDWTREVKRVCVYEGTGPSCGQPFGLTLSRWDWLTGSSGQRHCQSRWSGGRWMLPSRQQLGSGCECGCVRAAECVIQVQSPTSPPRPTQASPPPPRACPPHTHCL